jgi:NADH:ubiquinone oxidoreductase subunit 6 (subunit J)
MQISELFVAACFLMGTISAVFVAFHPNILYAAVALIFSLLSVAGFYAALGADFLAAAQLIIYVGAIVVVILFAVMMSEDIYRGRLFDNLKRFLWPTVFSSVILFAVVKLLLKTNWTDIHATFERTPTTRAMGLALVGPYAVVFQYVAIVLLLGLIGAVVVARPEFQIKSDEDEDV